MELRSTLLITIMGVSVALENAANSYRMAVSNDLSCAYVLLAALLVVPMIGGVEFIYMLKFWIEMRRSEQINRANLNSLFNQITSERNNKTETGDDETDLMSESSSQVIQNLGLSLRNLKRLTGSGAVIFAIFLIDLPSLIYYIWLTSQQSEYSLISGCRACRNDPQFLQQMLTSHAAATLVLIVGFSRVVRSAPDPFGLILETRRSLLFGGVLALVLYGWHIVAPLEFDNFHTARGISVGLWLMFAIHCVSPVYIAYNQLGSGNASSSVVPKVRRGTMKQTESISIKVSKQDFDAFLNDHDMYEAFKLHLQHEFGSESLRFYTEVKKWKDSYRDMTQKTRKTRASKIVKVFVGNNAVAPVNLPSDLAKELQTGIKDENFEPTEEFFDNSSKEIKNLMYNDSFRQRFIFTETFHAWYGKHNLTTSTSTN